jgi:outer membrane protein OmpA-like peptidoglycan-associated protein
MIALAGPGAAQTAPEPGQAEEQDSLKVYFESGSDAVGEDQRATLDQAARLFRDGSPIVMIVAGGADTVGAPDSNLDLSVRRAQAVVDGLVARGIPADRLQLLGRGNSELAVETPTGVDSRENRIVEITWR